MHTIVSCWRRRVPQVTLISLNSQDYTVFATQVSAYAGVRQNL